MWKGIGSRCLSGRVSARNDDSGKVEKGSVFSGQYSSSCLFALYSFVNTYR
jgi:hypothetical protein